jgi:hypothetical protein
MPLLTIFSIAATSVATVLDFFPDFFPFFAPVKGSTANDADLGGEMRLRWFFIWHDVLIYGTGNLTFYICDNDSSRHPHAWHMRVARGYRRIA